MCLLRPFCSLWQLQSIMERVQKKKVSLYRKTMEVGKELMSFKSNMTNFMIVKKRSWWHRAHCQHVYWKQILHSFSCLWWSSVAPVVSVCFSKAKKNYELKCREADEAEKTSATSKHPDKVQELKTYMINVLTSSSSKWLRNKLLRIWFRPWFYHLKSPQKWPSLQLSPSVFKWKQLNISGMSFCSCTQWCTCRKEVLKYVHEWLWHLSSPTRSFPKWTGLNFHLFRKGAKGIFATCLMFFVSFDVKMFECDKVSIDFNHGLSHWSFHL